jgi:hypothetical protein
VVVVVDVVVGQHMEVAGVAQEEDRLPVPGGGERRWQGARDLGEEGCPVCIFWCVCVCVCRHLSRVRNDECLACTNDNLIYSHTQTPHPPVLTKSSGCARHGLSTPAIPSTL